MSKPATCWKTISTDDARATPEQVLASDRHPATFLGSPISTTYRGNVAGSEEHGFWRTPPEHPTGPSQSAENDRRVWPRRTRHGFTGNVAHSNEHTGLFVDNGPNPPGVLAAPNYDPRINPAPERSAGQQGPASSLHGLQEPAARHSAARHEPCGAKRGDRRQRHRRHLRRPRPCCAIRSSSGKPRTSVMPALARALRPEEPQPAETMGTGTSRFAALSFATAWSA